MIPDSDILLRSTMGSLTDSATGYLHIYLSSDYQRIVIRALNYGKNH